MKNLLKTAQLFIVIFFACQICFAVADHTKSSLYTENFVIQDSQTDADIEVLLREIEKDGQFTVGRVEYEGDSVHGLFHKLRRKTLLIEGDIYTRKNLEQSVENFNRLKAVEGMSLKDVVLTLDRANKIVVTRFIIRLKQD